MTRIPVSPEMIAWACERAGYDMAYIEARLPQLPAWVRRERQPTLKQLEKLARVTHTPLGYLMLPEPPEERLPVPDYRTLAEVARSRPSPNLLDTLYTMRRRQQWLRESLMESEADPWTLWQALVLPTSRALWVGRCDAHSASTADGRRESEHGKTL